MEPLRDKSTKEAASQGGDNNTATPEKGEANEIVAIKEEQVDSDDREDQVAITPPYIDDEEGHAGDWQGLQSPEGNKQPVTPELLLDDPGEQGTSTDAVVEDVCNTCLLSPAQYERYSATDPPLETTRAEVNII